MKGFQNLIWRTCMLIFLFFASNMKAQDPPKISQQADALRLEKGLMEFFTPAMHLQLIKSSQTVAGMKPVADPGFDFTPDEWLKKRSSNGFYHLGDLNLRLRKGTNGPWLSYSTANMRAPVQALPAEGNMLAVADLANTFPDSLPLQIIRSWEVDDDQLILRFKLKNTTSASVEIGALGIPLIFNNILEGKELDQAHADNVFFDPYIGMDAGYLQVVRLNGHGPVLLVVPEDNTPFEAYRPLLDDPTQRGITFEGFHEWMVFSKAYAEEEWKDAKPWNIPGSEVLEPGESYVTGLRFIMTDQTESIEKTLIRNNRPVAAGIPGYVLPQDVKGHLFLKYSEKVSSMRVEPEGALEITSSGKTKNGWLNYTIQGIKWGRARLQIIYGDSLQQTVNYKIIKPESQVVADNGNFLTTRQWFEKSGDLFHRSPSVITYDYEKQEQVTQDSRAWICGLSDEGGAGSWLNAIMKQLVQPNPEEIRKLESFVNKTLWGSIQYSDGNLKYGVKKSMFFYEPDSMPKETYSKDIDFDTWAAWNREEAGATHRSYNYPHVAAAHWVMYRLARNYKGLVSQQSWQWYLEHAYHTVIAMAEQAPYYAQFGQMEGTVFLLILDDLKKEGFGEMAENLEKTMKVRADHWASLNYPFGSEMPWDSTGQEEVYMWSDYFGFEEKALVTLNAILAYMPTIPHWAYNGNARRYWDFLYGGQLSRIERMIHHYGSGLNAIPVLNRYREKPEDLYLLRVGYGGVLGTLSNITEDGFAPCAFHSFPSTLNNDAISGDYGSGFFGYAINTATYITHDEEFGWLAFGGNLIQQNENITVNMTTAGKSRVYLAPYKLWLTLSAGSFRSVSFDPERKKIKLVLDRKNEFTPEAFLQIHNEPEISENKFSIKSFSRDSRGLVVIPLEDSPKTVEIYSD
ncbi:MAG: DUF5695 domain-containing protein [Mangrovibacterium sp.]